MKSATLFAWIFLILHLGGPAVPGASELPPGAQLRAGVVVELFTSQGCSSCPPADALLAELSEYPEIVALSLHVDYWNYTGWEDPFASAIMTARQRGYATAQGRQTLYTPEMVIDGRIAVPGSQRGQVEDAIRQSAERRRAVEIDIQSTGVRLSPGHAPHRGATIHLALYERDRTTKVEQGENAGRALRNVNVVREWRELGVWHGTAMLIPLDLQAVRANGFDGFAVLVQVPDHGPILGAREVRFAP